MFPNQEHTCSTGAYCLTRTKILTYCILISQLDWPTTCDNDNSLWSIEELAFGQKTIIALCTSVSLSKCNDIYKLMEHNIPVSWNSMPHRTTGDKPNDAPLFVFMTQARIWMEQYCTKNSKLGGSPTGCTNAYRAAWKTHVGVSFCEWYFFSKPMPSRYDISILSLF